MSRRFLVGVSALASLALCNPALAQAQLGFPGQGQLGTPAYSGPLPNPGGAGTGNLGTLGLPFPTIPADVKTTPKAFDDLTDAERNAIAQDFFKGVSPDPAKAALAQSQENITLKTYFVREKNKKTHDEWARYFSAKYSTEPGRMIDLTALKLGLGGGLGFIGSGEINALKALGITTTPEAVQASLNKFKAANVLLQMQDLRTIIILDAVVNELKKSLASPPQGGGPTVIPASVPPLSAGAMEGTYRYEPYSNAWQEGTLSLTGDFRMKWTNKAGASWGLTADLASGVLRKDEGSPYQNEPNGKEFIFARDAMGNVSGFQFKGDFYKRVWRQ